MLLIELFKRLSHGSNYLLFVNWETFRALGVEQADYYDLIMKRVLFNGYSKENLQKCVDLLSVLKDPYELSYNMYFVFSNNLKVPDNKLLAIDLLKEKVKDLKEKLVKQKDSYEIENELNNSVLCVMNIYFSLFEIDIAIKYFNANYVEKNKEVKAYILLNELEDASLNEYWIREYEKNLGKIDYRDSLKEQYNKLKL